MKIKRKIYSSANSLFGTTYYPAQAAADYLLLPAEKILDNVEAIPVVKNMDSVKKKTSRIKRTIKPIREYINYKFKNKK